MNDLNPRKPEFEEGDDDHHQSESEGLARGWYADIDDPHEPDDEVSDEPDHPRM